MNDAEKKPSDAESEDGGQKESMPSPEARKNVVELAVKFLNNPKVMSYPMDARKAFLRKKGLNEAEVDAAIKMAALTQPTMIAGSGSTPPPPPPRPLMPLSQRRTSWTWNEYAVMTTVVGGVGYVLFHFIKSYVIPWINARREQSEKLEAVQASVNQLHSSMSETISTLTESSRAVQVLLSEQQQHVQLLTAQVTGLQSTLTQQTYGQPLKQLKDEISTLKGLLLNRHQFPASPTPGAANVGGARIPDWQRAQALPNAGSSIPLKIMTDVQQEHSSFDEVEESLQEKGDEANVPRQKSVKVNGCKEGMTEQEAEQTRDSDQVAI